MFSILKALGVIPRTYTITIIIIKIITIIPDITGQSQVAWNIRAL
jgi:hypothetical protein